MSRHPQRAARPAAGAAFLAAERAGERGFTLLQLIIALALVAILAAIATPDIVTMRSSQQYRQAAHQASTMLRAARSNAIAFNLQYLVVFKPLSNSLQMSRGNQPYGTSAAGYGTPLQTISFPPSVQIRSGAGGSSNQDIYVQFNPNGTALLQALDGVTASDGNLSINDTQGRQKYLVTTTQTGRITTKAF